ncbi:MAG: YraN family protein [Armatimonadetes bacterium]|nr:YraN family protein [Armatimonadota bacterium]
MSATTRRDLGAAGEEAAAAWLEARGYQVIARNLRTRQGEIDLIARRGLLVVFVEVKSRTSDRFGHPAEAIVPWKRHRLARLAAACVQRLGLQHCEVRFDAVAVYLEPDGRVREIEHIQDAFGADG